MNFAWFYFPFLVALSVAVGPVAFAGDLTKGDVAKGKTRASACVACHGPDGNSANPEWPKLAGQSSLYIIKQLRLFRTGERGNPLMTPMAKGLSDQDVENLGAYFASQTTSPGAARMDLVSLGQEIYRGGNSVTKVPACLSCHGPTGVGNPAAKFPKLSFQHAAYVEIRLKAYRDGVYSYKGSEIMNGIATNLSDEEIKAVSSYIQGLH